MNVERRPLSSDTGTPLRLLFFALDSASGDAGKRLAAGLSARGHHCFASVYNRDEALEARLKTGFSQAGATVVQTRAMRGVPLRQFLVDRQLRKEVHWYHLPVALVAAVVFWCARVAQIDRAPVFWRIFGRGPQTVLRTWASLASDKAEARRLLKETRPDVVVLNHDYAGHFSTTLAIIARSEGVRVAIIPALYPEPELLVRALARRPQNLIQNARSRAVAKRRPDWRAQTDGITILRYEWWRVELLISLGLAPRQPFVHQSCPADAVLLPDAAMAARYGELGFERALLKVTGSVVQDELAMEYSPESAARIVVAVPPDQSAAREKVDGGYQGLISRLIEICTSLPGCTRLVASVHPKQDEAALAPLIAAGFDISRQPLSALLPGAAAMLGYVGSSTLRWGTWAGTPVIAWDAYGYEPGQGGHTLDTISPIRPWMQITAADQVRSALTNALTTAGAAAWRSAYARLGLTPPDGSALDRIEAALQELARCQLR
ncbi:hypothetical protein FLX56_03840 [Synechococcus moorigangaii CMS01]|nr:hypothetical protein [Synechococcus moorigangaii CMS01]